MRYFAIILTGLLLFACNRKSSESQTAQTASQDSITKPDVAAGTNASCYEFVQEKDTIALTYSNDGNLVNGHLSFKNHEKDSSHGPVTGYFAADTLKLDYTFQSEGIKSVREVYFLKSGDNSLLMGIGEMSQTDGKEVFTNPKLVKYDQTIVLMQTECD